MKGFWKSCMIAPLLAIVWIGDSVARIRLQTRIRVPEKLSTVRLSDGRAFIEFVNPNMGWIANERTIWQTLDGGRNWQIIFRGLPTWHDWAIIEEFQFIGPQNGWIAVSGEGLFKTEDGGRQWLRLPNPDRDLVIQAIRFIDEGKRGWVGGVVLRSLSRDVGSRTPRNGQYALLAGTTDGGLTWKNQTIASTRAIQKIWFKGSKGGWALGSPGLFRHSPETDEWYEVDLRRPGRCQNILMLRSLDSTNVVQGPTALGFSNAYVGWLSFKNGYVAQTTDAGETWCDLASPEAVWKVRGGETFFWRLQFLNTKNGWAAGDGGIYQTLDGGRTWAKVKLPDEVKDFFILDAQNGWAVTKDAVYAVRPHDRYR